MDLFMSLNSKVVVKMSRKHTCTQTIRKYSAQCSTVSFGDLLVWSFVQQHSQMVADKHRQIVSCSMFF